MVALTPSTTCRVYMPIEPDAYAAATVNSDPIHTRGFRRALVILSVGTMGASSTLTVKVQSDTVVGMSTPTDITGATFGALAAGTDDDTVLVGEINLDPTEEFIRINAVTATAAVDHGVTVVLFDPIEDTHLSKAAIASELSQLATAFTFNV